MTANEATKVLEGICELEAISLFYQRGGKADGLTIGGIKEACRMAAAVLRTQQEPNTPLTLKELREMDGEPVWIEWGGHPQAGWALVRVWSKASNTIYLTYHNGNTDLLHFVLNDGGKIYLRRPEEARS